METTRSRLDGERWSLYIQARGHALIMKTRHLHDYTPAVIPEHNSLRRAASKLVHSEQQGSYITHEPSLVILFATFVILTEDKMWNSRVLRCQNALSLSLF